MDVERRAAAELQADLPRSKVSIDNVRDWVTFRTVCRLIEQHDAFKREVSDAIDSSILTPETEAHLGRFILPDPVDNLTEAVRDACAAQGLATLHTPKELTAHLRKALAKRGLTITKKPNQ